VRIISTFSSDGPNLLPSSSSRLASWPRQELQTLRIGTRKPDWPVPPTGGILRFGTDAIQQTVAQAAAANGMRTIAVNGDVSQDAACVRMVDEVVSEFGYIDILIPRLSFDGNLSCLHPVTCFAAARYRSYPCF
jgi:hypothetical protein